MINPEHDCWWSRNKATQLYAGRDEFHASGVPLRVLVDALAEPDDYRLSVHDDCFSSVEPVDDESLARLIARTLEVHAYYLGRDYDWSGVVDELVPLLRAYRVLRLQSKRDEVGTGGSIEIQFPRRWRRDTKLARIELRGEPNLEMLVA